MREKQREWERERERMRGKRYEQYLPSLIFSQIYRSAKSNSRRNFYCSFMVQCKVIQSEKFGYLKIELIKTTKWVEIMADDKRIYSTVKKWKRRRNLQSDKRACFSNWIIRWQETQSHSWLDLQSDCVASC